MTWIYLLQYKSDYLKTIELFNCFVQKQFGTAVKIIRSDNDREFDNMACKKFFQMQGIVHQTSCAYRPQQNARVERKHRHVLEVARALMIQSGLNLSFWGEAVLTAAYIINRLPSSVLGNKTPYELLYNEPIDYAILKYSGCLCFVVNPTHSSDKFAPRGVPYVFVGYPPTQKGYRLLDLSTMQLFVSRDVTFNETVFPLNVTTPKPYMLPLPTVMPTNSVNMYIDDDFTAENFCEDPIINESPAPTNESFPSSTLVLPAPAEPICDVSSSPNLTTETQRHQTPPRRSSRPHKPPSWMEPYVTKPFPNPSANLVTITEQPITPLFNCFLTSLTTHKDPTSFKQDV